MPLPALLMHIDSTPGTIVDMGSGLFTTNGTIHWLLPGCRLNLTLLPISASRSARLHNDFGVNFGGNKKVVRPPE